MPQVIKFYNPFITIPTVFLIFKAIFCKYEATFITEFYLVIVDFQHDWREMSLHMQTLYLNPGIILIVYKKKKWNYSLSYIDVWYL